MDQRVGMGARSLVTWAGIAVVIGVICGLASLLLTFLTHVFAQVTAANDWLLWCLPLAGLASVGIYQLLGVPWFYSTNTAVSAASQNQPLTPAWAPAILAGVLLTNLMGGVAGRGAAALQMGAALGSGIGAVFTRRFYLAPELGDDREGTFVMCGMAGAFSALMFTPLAASLFVLELTRSHAGWRRVLPVVFSACVGYAIARPFGLDYPWHRIHPMESVGADLHACVIVSLAAMAMGVVFCLALNGLRRLSWGRFSKPWMMALWGGIVVVVLSHGLGFVQYWGTGMDTMMDGIAGEAGTWDFAGKAVFCVLVLGLGFKGGEIMPILSIGASLGCVIGSLMGFDPSACAGIGLVAILAATTNCPVAAALMGIEAFGLGMAPYLLIAALVGFLPTARVGIYDANVIHGHRGIIHSIADTFGGLGHWYQRDRADRERPGRG